MRCSSGFESVFDFELALARGALGVEGGDQEVGAERGPGPGLADREGVAVVKALLVGAGVVVGDADPARPEAPRAYSESDTDEGEVAALA
jgi:hypothetical protein